MKRFILTAVVGFLSMVMAGYATTWAFQHDMAEASAWTDMNCPSVTTTLPVQDPRHVVVKVDCPDGFTEQSTVVKAKLYEQNYTTVVWVRDGVHFVQGELKPDGLFTDKPYGEYGPLIASLTLILFIVCVAAVVRQYGQMKPARASRTTPA